MSEDNPVEQAREAIMAGRKVIEQREEIIKMFPNDRHNVIFLIGNTLWFALMLTIAIDEGGRFSPLQNYVLRLFSCFSIAVGTYAYVVIHTSMMGQRRLRAELRMAKEFQETAERAFRDLRKSVGEL